ncbi:MAG: ATP-dependent sacrificial sulfur transferase LarE [bacterium]|nr:ATP-dependent sacrificial sulfur transferase LarE [bacterium]
MKTNDPIEQKFIRFKEILTDMESVLVAYSGGVDSTFVLKVAKDMLGDKVIAVTELSPVYPSEETEQAEVLARQMEVPHQFFSTEELSNPDFVNNPENRCYWCKKELFASLLDIAKEHRLNYVLDGSNFDDIDDFRPGMQAAEELGIRSPLKEACLTKEDIRHFSRQLGLSTWNKPSFACLASRFPYGMKITKENLDKIDKAERFLRKNGMSQVRVRHHDNIARIEVLEEEFPQLLLENQFRTQLISYFKTLGYFYVTIDLEGYRAGSMNEVLK